MSDRRRYWLQKVKKIALKTLVLIFYWGLATGALTLFLQPEKKIISVDLFQVCILENDAPHLIRYQDYSSQPLCMPTQKREGSNGRYHSFEIYPVDDQLEITEWRDSPGDPFVYRYQIDNASQPPKVVLLWSYYGGMARTFSNILLGLFIAAILLKITVYFYVKKSRACPK